MNEETLALISRRERQILVHSYLYYEMDSSIIGDYTWSMWAQELYDLCKEHPEEFKASPYYKQFKKFDPCTGFKIYKGVEDWVEGKAKYLLKIEVKE